MFPKGQTLSWQRQHLSSINKCQAMLCSEWLAFQGSQDSLVTSIAIPDLWEEKKVHIVNYHDGDDLTFYAENILH